MTGNGDRDAPDDARQRGTSGKPGSPWRGPRPEARGSPAPPPGAFGDSWSGRAEVEELPAQPVLPRGSPRLGLGGTVAIGAIVGLVAVGFGILGGRPEQPQLTPPARASAAALLPSPPAPTAPAPLVTPWTECGEPNDESVGIVLEVGGRRTPGNVESLLRPGGRPSSSSTPEPMAAPESSSIPRLEVPADVVTEIWIEGGVCAVAWSIELVGAAELDHVAAFDSVSNPARDLQYASQNRFPLALGLYRGGDYELRAALVFSTDVLLATWPIHIRDLARPMALLRWDTTDIPMVDGCDIRLVLGNGYTEEERDCALNHVEVTEPWDPIVVSGAKLALFQLGDWSISNAFVTCGQLDGQSFVLDPSPGCMVDADGGSFRLPPGLGIWVLEISACASQSTGTTFNQVCGTWYAKVDVRA